ncbi:MAG: hypothetical protein GEV11_15720 [Streptosporangiales bacterium]|nr:hypothetical protein [Streptosporangiales bacterium]
MSRIFALDATVADCRCGHCGAIAALATARVYTRCPGNVFRCTTCGEVLMRLTELPDRMVLDLGGGTALTFRSPPGPA